MFGERLRQLRNEARMSQMTLAAKAGLNLATVNLLENGKQRPSLDTAVKLARALNTSVDVLVGKPEAVSV